MARPDRPVKHRRMVRELHEPDDGLRAAGPGGKRRDHRYRDRTRFAAVVDPAVAESDLEPPQRLSRPAHLLGELGHLVSEFWLGALLPTPRRLLSARGARKRQPAAASRRLGTMG